MPLHNSDIADKFNRVADLLDIKGENPYRIRAYRNAAQTISGLSRSVAESVENEEDLSELSGIGKDLAGKIEEIVKTGGLEQLRQLEKEVPTGLLQLLSIEDLGPKRVKQLHEEIGVKSIEDLEKAAKEGKIQQMEGFGKKTAEKILEAIERARKEGPKKRFRLDEAEERSLPLLDYLKKTNGVKNAEIAGSYRRRKETVGDIDILLTCKKGTKIMDRFVNYEDVQKVISKGNTRSSVMLRNNLQVDLRVVPEVSYGAAMLYFTGSKAHNVALRKKAVENDWKMNEYGLFEGKKRIGGKTEEDIYEKFGLQYIEPELRENRGELDAAANNELPDLVKLKDIRGDLQSHTKATDGKYSLEEMATAAKEKGYDYFAITDHSKRVTVANGMDEKRLLKQLEEIDRINEKIKGIHILKSVEVDILKDGTLDLADEVLEKLDIVICSIHYNFKLSKQAQTRRVLKAMEHPCFHILAHPTGRMLGKREPYEIDLEKVIDAAKENRCYLEINAQPDRLDLNDVYAGMAKEKGVKLAISTDAHTISDLDLMRFGVGQARRAWLQKEDVLNTHSWKEIKKMLRKK